MQVCDGVKGLEVLMTKLEIGLPDSETLICTGILGWKKTDRPLGAIKKNVQVFSEINLSLMMR